MKLDKQDYESLSLFLDNSFDYLYREMKMQKAEQGYVDRSLIQSYESMRDVSKIVDRIK